MPLATMRMMTVGTAGGAAQQAGRVPALRLNRRPALPLLRLHKHTQRCARCSSRTVFSAAARRSSGGLPPPASKTNGKPSRAAPRRAACRLTACVRASKEGESNAAAAALAAAAAAAVEANVSSFFGRQPFVCWRCCLPGPLLD
jgi:hypothetical protein